MYQVWTFSLPVREISAINKKMTIGNSTIQFFGREIVYEIDFDPSVNVNGSLNRLDVPILVPPALAPAKRNSTPDSSIGALEMPSPHQITIWPSFLLKSDG
jgi:hypothetical protein